MGWSEYACVFNPPHIMHTHPTSSLRTVIPDSVLSQILNRDPNEPHTTPYFCLSNTSKSPLEKGPKKHDQVIHNGYSDTQI